MTDLTAPPADASRAEQPSPPGEALTDRVFASAVGALELFSIHLGRSLGLYGHLTGPPVTCAELAQAAGLAPRYAREWLEQQAVAGFVTVSDEAAPELRRYRLPEAHVPTLLAENDPLHVAPLADMVAGIAGVLDRLPEAFRTGAGVPYADYGAAFRHGQAAVNRPVIQHDLPTWLEQLAASAPAMRRPGARIADVGCGLGHSTRVLATSFPSAHVAGYDVDAASIEDARRLVTDTELASRVSFHAVDAADSTAMTGPVDLVLVFEALHDLARPVEALQEARSVLAPGGVVMVVDERVSEQFYAPGDEVERLMYGWSVSHCLPAALAETPSAGLGTVLRPDAVTALARAAGFTCVRELAVDHDFFRVYALEG